MSVSVTKIRLLASDVALPALQQTHGTSLYAIRPIPQATYPGLEGDVPVVSVANILAVHAEMPAQLAYEITKALFDHKDELVAIHPEAKNLTLSSAVDGSPAAFHEGAVRYYSEQDAWPK